MRCSSGRDYALTEIVHCKSKNEIGVTAVMAQCPQRFLLPILGCSAAKLVVAVGKKALGHFNGLDRTPGSPFGGIPAIPVYEGVGPLEICGKQRILVYLAAPAGFGASASRIFVATAVATNSGVSARRQKRNCTLGAGSHRLGRLGKIHRVGSHYGFSTETCRYLQSSETKSLDFISMAEPG